MSFSRGRKTQEDYSRHQLISSFFFKQSTNSCRAWKRFLFIYLFMLFYYKLQSWVETNSSFQNHPKSFRDSPNMVLPQAFTILYFHHAKFQILFKNNFKSKTIWAFTRCDSPENIALWFSQTWRLMTLKLLQVNYIEYIFIPHE